MISRASSHLFRRVAVRAMSSEAVGPTSVTLNFALPHDTIYDGASVYRVIIPGVEGEYGVGAGHVPVAAQLKPGVLQVLHEESSEPEKYFVAGGYALTKEDSTTDVVCPEAVKLDDIDSAIVSKQYEAAKSAFASAAAGTPEQAEAQIDMEVNKAMGLAVGLTLA
mmetsp:Transcript_4197/g.9032  ORF Transcript_4197/g.9032 Transcript_4197/m.9032 type:complete len:165 (-) Transcript_4197:86-580(-)|eukprot:CAMPEP_0172439272 /NCGR_PEP_ID=MMETSP1065-20121228/314_1 /TAXON_ID=265537 /ORGANISM="Amphiprora paludosa, Strain CCMP125" /LENGTH=164 /DNA_ID=CAMNT_0013187927 /DNA_START=91 /DNA_END=585 /DNA_ORIENTATION=+